jgi:hypothetical protein
LPLDALIIEEPVDIARVDVNYWFRLPTDSL